jgi:hypothetical protein
MKKIIIPLLLIASLYTACEARREPVTIPPEPEAAITEMDTADIRTLDSLSNDSVNTDSVSAASVPDTASAGHTGTNIIGSRQAGPVKINMSVADLKKVIPANQLKEVKVTREGHAYKAYQIKKNASDAQPGLQAEEICEPNCRVSRVQVLDSTYKTPEGIGIGSTLGEVKKHYPISYLGPGETGIVAVSETKKITFILDVSKVPAKQAPQLSLKNTPNEVPVTGILIL